MAASQRDTSGTLPRWFRAFFVPMGGVALVLFFLIRGFPYDSLVNRITSTLEPVLGVEFIIAEVGPTFGWAGPGLEALGVHVRFPDANSVRVDRILVRPAWTTAWFRGGAAVYLELDSPSGSAMGSLEFGESPVFEGSVQNLDLEELALLDILPSGGVEGRMDATFSLVIGEAGPEGSVTFEMRDGSLSIPNMPIALPFQKILGELQLGGDAYLTIESLTLEGPIVSGSGGGTIAKAPSFERAPLRMEFDLNVKPALAGGARAAGLRVDSKGDTKVRISGTVSNPRIR